MNSYLKNYRQSPRKVRLVADTVRGKKVDIALRNLAFVNKRAVDPIAKLIMSAVSNARNNFNAKEENLYVKEIRVDKGITLKRIMPRARGTAFRINKRSSHVEVVLEEKAPVEKKTKKVRAPKATK